MSTARNRIPLFAWLRKAKPGLLGSEAIKWNFTKFLIDRDGNLSAQPVAPWPSPRISRSCWGNFGATAGVGAHRHGRA